MVTAVVPNADELIAARRASGEDRFDEVIRGVYYMVPPRFSPFSTQPPTDQTRDLVAAVEHS